MCPNLANNLAAGPASAAGGVVLGYGLFSALPVAGTTAGDLYIATDSPVNMWVWDGSEWRPKFQTTQGTKPPAAAGFTAFNSTGTLALADNSGCLKFTGVDDGTGAVGTLRGFEQNLPAGSTPYVELGTQYDSVDVSPTSGFNSWIVGMRESATNKAFGVATFCNQSTGSPAWETDVWTSNTARTGTVRGVATLGDSQGPVFARVRLDGAGNILAETSRGLRDWQTLATQTVAGAFTTAPNKVFIGALGIGVKPIWNVVHYKAA